jgi:hypothetical protein
MNGRSQMQGGKNWILPKELNANRFFWDSQWLKIWVKPYMSLYGTEWGSVAMDSAGKAVPSSRLGTPRECFPTEQMDINEGTV